jgi:hypothetical protein
MILVNENDENKCWIYALFVTTEYNLKHCSFNAGVENLNKI